MKFNKHGDYTTAFIVSAIVIVVVLVVYFIWMGSIDLCSIGNIC